MGQCIRTGHHWRHIRLIADEENVVLEMMRKWDSCHCFLEMLCVVVGNVSVFYYNATLANWAFGLHLVRFENKPRAGRCLEII